MGAAVDDEPSTIGGGFERRAALPIALLSLLLLVVALQRGGYFAESWGLPTAACGWAVTLAALLGNRQRLRPIEIVQLGGLAALGGLALLSAIWAPGGLGSALPQAQLLALHVAALAAVLMLFRSATALLAAIWGSMAAIAFVGLETRLFPASVARDTIDGDRLSQPLGYWNSLGLWSGMALVLGIVLSGRANSVTLRAAAAAGSVPCAVTLYFTFSRGAWIALAVGLVVAIAADPRRLGFMAWVMLLGPFPAIGVILASRAEGLTAVDRTLEQARHDGRSLTVALVILSAIAALAALSLTHVQQNWRVPHAMRSAFACLLIAACAVGLAGVVVQFGAPWTIADRLAQRFGGPSAFGGDTLDGRLFDLSSNGRISLWRVAWDDAQRHPLMGSGAGTYEAEWYRNRLEPLDATNAHQLYLETLAELGPLGLALLLVALGAPLAAAWRARRHALAAGATAAYVAFVVHVAVDWDWQMAAVALAALMCGAALFVMARATPSPAPTNRARATSAAAGAALAAFALWSAYGAHPLGKARDAADDGNWSSAEAHAWDAVSRVGGWSATSWRLLGEAQTARGKPAAARTSLRVAVRRDPSSWRAWYDLAIVGKGAERRAAARKALSLNPLGEETRDLPAVADSTPSPP